MKIGTGTNFGVGNSKMEVSKSFEKGSGHFWEGGGALERERERGERDRGKSWG